MKYTRKMRLLAVLLSGTIAFSSHAQDVGEADQTQAPDFSSLESSWWSYFEQPGDGSRVALFTDYANERIETLPTPDQQTAHSILAAITDNISAYRALQDENGRTPKELPEPLINYSLDTLFELAAEARSASALAEQGRLEVEREQRILDGATRRRDLTFKSYVNASAGDEKLLSALRLVHDRSAQAIAERRMQLLTLRQERASAYADQISERVEYASSRLATTPEEAGLVELIKQLDVEAAGVSKNREQLRAEELAATRLDLDTEQGRSQHRLQKQKVVDAEVVLALSEISLAEMQATRWWTEVQLATSPDMDILQEQALGWSELTRRVEEEARHWERDTEDEVLAVQTVTRDGLDRSSRRLLDQRMGTAQVTLKSIDELEDNIANLELASDIVDDAVAEYSGALSSWLSSLTRGAKTLSSRAMGLGDVRLFSIGDTPVTGGGIVRILIILLLAFLLSRGIRHAIARVIQSESDGTQASLYTVGRLTHYAIVFIAILIALSSIGLDFSSLALVAGALGVGIGFGLQSIVSNFVSGLIILFEHSLRVGDYIELDAGLTGTVKAINVRSTLINTNDNIDIVVPNSEFVTTRLTNWTLGERILRVRIPFGVAYGSDKELVRKAAKEAAEAVPYTLTHMKNREPEVWLVDFGDSSLNFLLLVWVNRQGARRPTRTRAAYLWELETKLTEYGIEIPFPQRDLNIRSGLLPPGLTSNELEKKLDEDES
jgi:potassium efflux system protein